MSTHFLQLLIGLGGLAISAIFIAFLFPSLCLPLALGTKSEKGHWRQWILALLLAIAGSIIYFGIIYVFAAFAGMAGSTAAVYSAASYMFFDMGGPWLLATVYWPIILAPLVRRNAGDKMKSDGARLAVKAGLFAPPLVFAAIGAVTFYLGLPQNGGS